MRETFRYFANVPGWHTSRKIVVFESDDWGSIRMPSLETFHILKRKGVDLTTGDSLRYNTTDTLASSEDLVALFEVLSAHKDKNGRACVFTPLCLVANPDFEKIRENNFTQYFYEPFTETLKKYPHCEKSFELWKQGIDTGLFMPQFHGREHLNITSWMKALQENHRDTRLAFDYGLWAIKLPNTIKAGGYQAAFLIKNLDETSYLESVLKEGLDLFEKIFNYRACYFTPPNGYFNNSLEETLNNGGINFLNTLLVQKEPVSNNKFKNRLHYLGQQNKWGQMYILRNVLFEPNQSKFYDLSECMKRIKNAFYLHKPAIISTHRTNFTGSLNPKNRDSGLNELNKLLKTLLKTYPDVEFMTTPELGQLILNK